VLPTESHTAEVALASASPSHISVTSGAFHNKYGKWAFTDEIAGLLVNMNNSLVKILVFNPVDWLTCFMDTAHNCKNNKAYTKALDLDL